MARCPSGFGADEANKERLVCRNGGKTDNLVSKLREREVLNLR